MAVANDEVMLIAFSRWLLILQTDSPTLNGLRGVVDACMVDHLNKTKFKTDEAASARAHLLQEGGARFHNLGTEFLLGSNIVLEGQLQSLWIVPTAAVS